jgi:hypothetical protein
MHPAAGVVADSAVCPDCGLDTTLMCSGGVARGEDEAHCRPGACAREGGGDNNRQKVHVAEQPVPCNFTHYIPSQMLVQGASHAALGNLEVARTSESQTDVEQSHTRECESTSQMLFTHNRMLCDEVLRLRQELKSQPHTPAPARADAFSGQGEHLATCLSFVFRCAGGAREGSVHTRLSSLALHRLLAYDQNLTQAH